MVGQRVLILGAAGRDFHNFNVLYRDGSENRVVAFTAQQIPHIADRRYPPELAGEGYPEGIEIHDESDLERLIDELEVSVCVLAYSDLAHEEVMHLASRCNAAGADFELVAPRRTMLRSSLPVVAVCATRTGAGKSQTSRAIVAVLREAGARVAVLRHPMPYGDLAAQRIQRFESRDDLERHRVTIEEREEYEPHLEMGSVVFAGVDYEAILREAEREADVVLWDGGNNDTSFLAADLYITIADAHRPGHELAYHPGETNARMADVVLINKVDTADPEDVARIRRGLEGMNPRARVVEAESPIELDDPAAIRGRRVVVVEDGPTLTHGGMAYGAGTLAAQRERATVVDPRPFAVGELAETYRRYPHLGPVIPAMGYGDRQVRELEETVAAAAAEGVEAVVVGTPIDLAAIIQLPIPHVRVRYGLRVKGVELREILGPILGRLPAPGS